MKLGRFLSSDQSIQSRKQQLCDMIFIFTKVKTQFQYLLRKEGQASFCQGVQVIWNIQQMIMTEERASEREDISIETARTEVNRDKKKKKEYSTVGQLQKVYDIVWCE